MSEHWECFSWAALGCLVAYRLGGWVAWRRAERRAYEYAWQELEAAERRGKNR